MFRFSSLFKKNLLNVGVAPTVPFSTQAEVLRKFKMAVNDKGDEVFMCRPMTNHYLDKLLKNQDPSDELRDERVFLNEAIREENREIDAIAAGEEDVDHFAFKQNGVPHIDADLPPGSLDQEHLSNILRQTDHVVMNLPLSQELAHQVYVGKDKRDAYSCRFFDANLSGGERKGHCDQILTDFAKHLNENYPLVRTSGARLAMAI